MNDKIFNFRKAIFDFNGESFIFSRADTEFFVYKLSDIPKALDCVDSARKRGFIVIGFLTFEAWRAFLNDSVELKNIDLGRGVKKDEKLNYNINLDLPLAWFGLFSDKEYNLDNCAYKPNENDSRSVYSPGYGEDKWYWVDSERWKQLLFALSKGYFPDGILKEASWYSYATVFSQLQSVLRTGELEVLNLTFRLVLPLSRALRTQELVHFYRNLVRRQGARYGAFFRFWYSICFFGLTGTFFHLGRSDDPSPADERNSTSRKVC
ncbi:hypothetical protein C7438_0026 [Brockia lithotrophica]|uniref:Uncharacterized protein n=1 Tax=Brockia lithotrophica TaxID=933949 RepID=A0A660L8Z8_9BACL|nr:hypothetical protein [Brockia lithotrophica]RKQ88393.1 hypothetical protein C7438_0026 [Brockia lithotrophica]